MSLSMNTQSNEQKSISLNADHQVLVFTDFDGTILDHYSYSFEAAKPSMDALKALGIPIIPNTSKTLAEVIELQKVMDLQSALIVENGAGIYIPKEFLPAKPRDAVWQQGYWLKSFAQKRQYWLDVLHRQEAEFGECYESFSQMSLERLIELTGLDNEAAKLAADRQFSEPLYWKGSEDEKARFIEKVTAFGARPLIGGRFMHICGSSNKGRALSWLQEEYQRQHPEKKLTSIALGDGKNDIDMLEIADYAVRITSPTHEPPALKRTKQVYTSTQHGPEGWAEIMQRLIPEISTRTKHG